MKIRFYDDDGNFVELVNIHGYRLYNALGHVTQNIFNTDDFTGLCNCLRQETQGYVAKYITCTREEYRPEE